MDILFEDEQLLVLNKPAGLPVLPDGWEKDAPYLVEQLEAQYSKIWIVHRLDKVTSGVMVFAKNAEAHRELNIQFEKHSVDKIYHAIANGLADWDEKIARHKLRINVGHHHRTMVDPTSGKSAETHFRVLERFREQMLLEARPLTGRTHQVRVHAYALGYPLIGDTIYSAPETDTISRAALHAKTLAFVHPVTKQRLNFGAPYPDDFNNALKMLRDG